MLPLQQMALCNPFCPKHFPLFNFSHNQLKVACFELSSWLLISRIYFTNCARASYSPMCILCKTPSRRNPLSVLQFFFFFSQVELCWQWRKSTFSGGWRCSLHPGDLRWYNLVSDITRDTHVIIFRFNVVVKGFDWSYTDQIFFTIQFKISDAK